MSTGNSDKITQVATDTILEMPLPFFIGKRSGSAAVRSVGNRGSPVPEAAHPHKLCYKGDNLG